jgi:hypothetical protein
LRDAAIALAVAVALSAPFLIYNRLSSPKFAYSGDEARNSPFTLKVASQTLSLLTVQVFFSSFPTFESSPKPKVRRKRIAEWNAWWNTHVFRNVDQSKQFTHATYQFEGVTDPRAALHFENTEWAGLLPWLFVVCGGVLIVRRRLKDWLPAALGLALLAWWVTYGMTMKYFPTVGTYFAYPVIICGAFMAGGMVRGTWRPGVWAISILAGGVAVGHLALCWNILLFNPHHSLKSVAAAIRSGEATDASAPRFGLGRAMAGGETVTLLATHWAVPYYEIIKASPATRFRLGRPSETTGPTVTAIQSKPTFDGFLPIKVSLPPNEGLVYLDTISCSYGLELIFGDASTFGPRIPEARSRYLVLQARLDESDAAKRMIRVSSKVMGDGARGLRYRATLVSPEATATEKGWSDSAKAEIPAGDASAESLQLRIEVADATGQILGSGTFSPFLVPKVQKPIEVNP